jgi:hypothetical protein
MKATLINVSAIENLQGELIPKIPQHFEHYYPIICDWWKEWNWPQVNPRCLPDDGIIIDEDGENICAGWLWLTNSSLGAIGYFISAKKKFTKGLRDKAIEFLIENLERLAQFRGCKELTAAVRHPNLINNLVKAGYGEGSRTGKGDINITMFSKKI